MSDDQSLSAEAVIMGESVLIGLTLAASCYNDFPPAVSVEFLFPAHVCFYLLTYSYKNPQAYFGQKLLSTWLLVFGDLLLSLLLLGGSLPSSWLVFQAVFFAFFAVFHFLPPHKLREEVEGHLFRGALFQLEAVYKAVVLIDSISAAMRLPGSYRAALAILVGMCRLSVPALVYSLQKTPLVSARSFTPFISYLRTSPLISLAFLSLLHYSPVPLSPDKPLFSPAHLAACLCFLAWYGFEAAYYLEKEAHKEN